MMGKAMGPTKRKERNGTSYVVDKNVNEQGLFEFAAKEAGPIGDPGRPRKYCLKCGSLVYCDNIWTEFPARTAEELLKKVHNRTGCTGKIQYMAAIAPGVST